MPTYVFGTDFISNTSEVIRLARNVLPADFATADVQSYQYKVYSMIRTMTNKDNWATTDREYGILQLLETEIAAEEIKKHYGETADSGTAAQANIDTLFKTLQTVVGNLDATISGGNPRRTTYKSWNLNTDMPIPRRGLTIV